jgi:succinyl-diaminopimelate desuccinylase
LLWLEFITRGKTAHGSMPELGENAILKMMEIAKKLTPEIFGPAAEHPTLGRSTISLNSIQGGLAPNVVPDFCSAVADIRLLPGQTAEQIEDILSLILDGAEYKTERLRYVEAFETPAADNFITKLSAITGKAPEAVFFTTDAPYLKPLTGSIAILGPGSPEMCHRPNEHIELHSLVEAKEIYKKILREFCRMT